MKLFKRMLLNKKAKEKSKHITHLNGLYVYEECQKIVNGELTFDESDFKQEILRSLHPCRKNDFGFQKYWEDCIEQAYRFYHETEASEVKDKLFKEMKRTTETKRNPLLFDFAKKEWGA